MPVLIIAAGFLVLFFIMGVMSVSAVASEHRLQREIDDYKKATGIPTETGEKSIAFKSATAGH
jgi:hypothetical protein